MGVGLQIQKAEAREVVRQGQYGGRGTALGPLSPFSLLDCFLPLGLGLQTLVRLMRASWAPGWSDGYGFFGVCVCSVLGGEKKSLKD